MIIPRPQTSIARDGYFVLSADTRIGVSGANAAEMQVAEFLAECLRPLCGLPLPVVAAAPEAPEQIQLHLQGGSTAFGDEGYQLVIAKEGITINAAEPAGLFYAVQSLSQLTLQPTRRQSANIVVKVPCLELNDHPRFPWRGMLLDCSRHFMSVDFIKRYLDLLAFHKMNVFHWHLTDDQGWRIEIKQYPELTEIGAWRRYEDGSRYGGFYSAADVQELVEYASRRFIRVVPEIELPGHALAALSAYPELSCSGGPFNVEVDWNIYKDVYCAGNNHTFEFLENVLTEVAEMFPGPYIHIGGDECLKDRWRQCPKCQTRIEQEGLADEHELQSYFIRRIQRHLQKIGRSLIGWDEILEGGLAPGAIVQSWRGLEGAIAAATAEHDAIVSPTTHAYFDYDLKTIDLARVYEFEPIPPELSEAQSKHIIGGECNMWSERAPQPYIDRQVFPRLTAMAEVLWSPKDGKDFQDFRFRLKQHYPRLEALGVRYGKETQCVAVTATFCENDAGCRLEVDNLGPKDSDLRYSMDGSQPTLQSNQWGDPVDVAQSTLLKTALFHQKKLLTGRKETRVLLSENELSGAARNGSAADSKRLWMAVIGDNLTAVLDLKASREIGRIDSHFLQLADAAIFLPISVEYAISEDGKEFEILWATGHNWDRCYPSRLERAFTYEPEQLRGRFIRLRAVNIGSCPLNHPQAGQAAWLGLQDIKVS